MEVGLKSWWIVEVVATAEGVGVEAVAAAAVSAVGLRDQLGTGSQSFVAISGCNLASVGARYFVPDGLAELDSPP